MAQRSGPGRDRWFWWAMTVAMVAVVGTGVLRYVADSVGDEQTLERVSRVIKLVREANDLCECPEGESR